MYSQDPAQQKIQMEALAAAVTAALAKQVRYTVITASHPNASQTAFETAWTTAGQALPITPDAEFHWFDNIRSRGVLKAIKDYFLPLTTGNQIIPGDAFAIRDVRWLTRTKWIMTAQYFTSTTAAYTNRSRTFQLDASWANFTTAAEEIISINHSAANPVLTVDGSNLLRRGPLAGVTTTSTTVNIGANRPAVAVQANNGDIYFRDSTNVNNVQKRTNAGVVSTIVTGFTNLADIKFDEVNQKVILFSNSSGTSAASTCSTTGTGLTSLIPSGLYAAGYLPTNYRYIGNTLRSGYLYVPVPNSPFMNTYRKYSVAAGTYTTETFDFGLAKPVLQKAVKEARGYLENAQGYTSQQWSYWGSEYYAYLFDKLIHVARSPDDDAWLLTYGTTTNTSAPQLSELAWGILPDSGCSGKVYPISVDVDPRGDFFVVKEYTYDVAVKEMTLDWSDVDLTQFGTIVITFDNGLTTATENIRIQLNGDTAAHYDVSFYREAVAVISNTTAAAQTYWELYGVNTTTVLGGKYVLTFVDAGNAIGGAVGATIEGFTATAVSTGTVNSILGVGKWATPTSTGTPVTSIRIFLSASTAFFAANAKIRVEAYRTQSRYSFVNNVVSTGSRE